MTTITPGTKMPSFYADPDNPNGPPDILGGKDDEQILALRDYVISLGLPEMPTPPAAKPADGTAAAPARQGADVAEAAPQATQ